MGNTQLMSRCCIKQGAESSTTFHSRKTPAQKMTILTSPNTADPNGPVGTVHYIYDLDGHLIAEASASTGATTREYIWLPSNDTRNDTMAEDMDLTPANDNVPDMPLAVVEGTTLYQVHTDHLGRPKRITDAAKATVWQATYKPWGAVQSISGSIINNLRFPGQYFQLETSLAYNWHRTYDPATGRYTQPDPLRFVDGPSIYAYAGNSPFMNVDPYGLDSGVIVWDPVGWGESSFGHTSAYSNGTSYSFGPSGMTVSPLSDYVGKNKFRDGKMYGLPMSTAKEDAFAKCLAGTNRNYNWLAYSCVDPVRQCLSSVGFSYPGPMLTPEDLEIMLRSAAQSRHTFSATLPKSGLSAPWTVLK
jgi:RHS repeat-associated protein